MKKKNSYLGLQDAGICSWRYACKFHTMYTPSNALSSNRYNVGYVLTDNTQFIRKLSSDMFGEKLYFGI